MLARDLLETAQTLASIAASFLNILDIQTTERDRRRLEHAVLLTQQALASVRSDR